MNKALKEFVSKIDHDVKRTDTSTLVALMQEESGYQAKLNGKIIGFGSYPFKYANGGDGESIVTGFAPRQQNIAIYIMPGFSKFQKDLEKLGKHKTSKVCLYINKLADVDEKVLRRIIKRSVNDMKKKYKLG